MKNRPAVACVVSALLLTLSALTAPPPASGYPARQDQSRPAPAPVEAAPKPAAPFISGSSAKPPAAAPTPTPPARKPPELPRDAGPHDNASSIEWWYFNTFLSTPGGRKLALVGSFFRVGLPGQKKGHYLIYSLAELGDNKTRKAYSVLDRQAFLLLRSMAQMQISLHPDDPAPYRLLAYLQDGQLPAPHQLLGENAQVKSTPRFGITMANNTMSQDSDDGRTWKALINGDSWTLDLTFQQPERPPMLVGGKGMTGVKRPDEMYYLSLTRMDVTGSLTEDGAVTNVTGTGWLDRQWGSPEFVQNYGWDWLGIQLEDGSDLILYRLRNPNTGDILKIEGTILTKDGQTIVEQPTVFRRTALWTHPATGIAFPAAFEITLPKSGYTLTVTPSFPDQTIPVLGIGEVIWEGVADITGTGKDGAPVTGQGFMELVGYRKGTPKKPPTTAPKPPVKPAGKG